MVGGLAPATQVGAFVASLDQHRQRTLSAWGEPDELVVGSFRQLREAASDALYRGLACCEATEIHSGFEGTLN